MSLEGNYVAAISVAMLFGVVGFFLAKFFNEGLKTTSCCQKICKCPSEIKPMLSKFPVPYMTWCLVFGLIARNTIEKYDFMGKDYPDRWASWMRLVGFGILLCTGSFNINYNGIGIFSLFLAIIPPIFELGIVCLESYYLNEMPIFISLAFGGLMQAVAPAVVIPLMLWCIENKLGVTKAIPSILMNCSNINMLLSILLFQIFKAKAISLIDTANNFSFSAQRVDFFDQVIISLAAGYFLSLPMKLFKKDALLGKFLAVLVIILGFVIGFNSFHMPIGMVIAIVLFAYFTNTYWEGIKPQTYLNYAVFVGNIMIFTTLGTSVSFSKINRSDVGYAFCIFLTGLVIRAIFSFLCLLMNSNLNFWEKLYLSICYLPKGTVQAVYATTIREEATDLHNQQYIRYGEQIQTTCVLSIITSFPLVTIFGRVTGHSFLSIEQKKPEEELSSLCVHKKAEDTIDSLNFQFENPEKKSQTIELSKGIDYMLVQKGGIQTLFLKKNSNQNAKEPGDTSKALILEEFNNTEQFLGNVTFAHGKANSTNKM